MKETKTREVVICYCTGCKGDRLVHPTTRRRHLQFDTRILAGTLTPERRQEALDCIQANRVKQTVKRIVVGDTSPDTNNSGDADDVDDSECKKLIDITVLAC